MAKRESPTDPVEELRTQVARLAKELHELSPKQKVELLEQHRRGSIEPLIVDGQQLSESEQTSMKRFIRELDATRTEAPTRDHREGAMDRAELALQLIERFVPELSEAARDDLEKGRTLLGEDDQGK
jgi:hypothetical protein